MGLKLLALVFGITLYCHQEHQNLIEHYERQYRLQDIEIERQIEASMPHFTEEEEWLLLAVTMLEGGNQTVNDKAMIMRVVLNRVESPKYPDNIKDVVFQPGQFAVSNRLQYAVPNEGCYEALELIKIGWDESNGVMNFWGDGKVNHFY